MRILVESLQRLYAKGKLTIEQLKERVRKNTISAEEYEYITGETYNN
jgi:hypothetical protein